MMTSLILSALFADDALTAREIAAVLGVRAAELRPALAELVAAGAVVTSGRTRGTRYCLALEEQAAADPCPAAMTAPSIGGPRVRLPKVRTMPATLDLMGALTEMAVRSAAGQGLREMRAG